MSIINELHVETYGTMSRKEKVEFILEQMRLTIANGDFVRAQIISKVCFYSKLELQKYDFYVSVLIQSHPKT